jgi:hypothetical protein
MSIDDRKYTEQEVGEILQKALEGEPGKSLAHSDGTSLEELKAIGAEVGIDPSRIEGAARALDTIPDGKVNPLLGFPTSWDYEARVPGELTPEDTPEAVAIIRRITGKPGKLTEIHGTVEWRTDGDVGSRWVTVSPNDGHTTIRASSRLGQGVALSFIPTLIATVVSTIPVLNAPSGDGNMMALMLIPVVLAVYFATRVIWSGQADREGKRLQQVVAELSQLAQANDPEA